MTVTVTVTQSRYVGAAKLALLVFGVNEADRLATERPVTYFRSEGIYPGRTSAQRGSAKRTSQAQDPSLKPSWIKRVGVRPPPELPDGLNPPPPCPPRIRPATTPEESDSLWRWIVLVDPVVLGVETLLQTGFGAPGTLGSPCRVMRAQMEFSEGKDGDPGAIRTRDPQLRRVASKIAHLAVIASVSGLVRP